MIRKLEFKIDGGLAGHTQVLKSLGSFPGVKELSPSDDTLTVSYDLRETDAASILEFAKVNGLATKLNRYERLKAWLRCYREAILKDDLNNAMGWDNFVREIYVSRYRHRRHGRRDDRPRHWRQYSSPDRAR